MESPHGHICERGRIAKREPPDALSNGRSENALYKVLEQITSTPVGKVGHTRK